MILAVDIGNTNITTGLYDKDKLLFVSRMATDRNKMPDQYAVEFSSIFNLRNINNSDFEGSIISSVVPELTETIKEAVEFITGKRVIAIGPGIKTGLNIKIDNPAQLGADLVAGAVGAIAKYPLPCFVLDMGTATKISVIDKNGTYLGCTISAGVKLALNALSSGTSQLPAIPLEAPKSAIGTNSVTSMQSGTVLGAAAMVDGLCKRLEKSLGEEVKTVIATGGIAEKIVKYCETETILDENLLLDGMKIIYEKNI